MSLKLSFASLSIGASVDQQTGSLSVFDIVEEIRTPQIPMHMQSFVISVAWEKQAPGNYDGRVFIHILTPDAKQAMIGNGELKVPADQRRLKAVFRLGGFPLMQWGEHRFVISWLNAAGEKEGDALLDFEVIQVAPPPGESEGQGGSQSGKPGSGSVTH